MVELLKKREIREQLAIKASKKLKNGFFRALLYLVLMSMAFVFLFPYIFMIVTSFKSSIQLLDMLAKWIPRYLHWENYSLAVQGIHFFRSLANSIILTSVTTVGHILSASLVAYGFSRYKFFGRNVLFALVIFSVLVPAQSIIVPLFIQYNRLGWINTYLPLAVPTYFGMGLRGGIFIFIFRQFFLGVPYELEEAARIDGLSEFGIYWRIVMRISTPAVLVAGILSMVWHWNDFYEPSMYLSSQSSFTLPMMLPVLTYNLESFMAVADSVNRGVIMAGTFLSILPVLTVYLILQRRFVASISRTGLTGM